MRALREKKLLQKFSGHITHYRVRVHREGISARLFHNPALCLRLIFYFSHSHLPETLSLICRGHNSWKISVLKSHTCFSICSNTIFGYNYSSMEDWDWKKWVGRQYQVRARAQDRRVFELIFRYLDLTSYHLFTKVPERFWTRALGYHIKCFISS